MPSLIFNSAVRDEATGAVDFDTDTFYAMLVTSAYVPNKDTHTKRSDVTNEVVGTGYAAGGIPVSVTVGAVDTVNDRVVVTFGAVSWPASTITARGANYYKRRGGLASADELVMHDDFGADVISTAGAFNLAASTITKQN